MSKKRILRLIVFAGGPALALIGLLVFQRLNFSEKNIAQTIIEKEISDCAKEVCLLGEIAVTDHLDAIKGSLNKVYRKKMEILKNTYEGIMRIDACGVKYSHLLMAAHYLKKSNDFCENQNYVDAERYLKLARDYLSLAQKVKD